MISVQEIVSCRGNVLDVIDENGNVVPVDRREDIILVDGEDGELSDEEATLREYLKKGWTTRARNERQKIDAKRRAGIGRRALAEIQNRRDT